MGHAENGEPLQACIDSLPILLTECHGRGHTWKRPERQQWLRGVKASVAGVSDAGVLVDEVPGAGASVDAMPVIGVSVAFASVARTLVAGCFGRWWII